MNGCQGDCLTLWFVTRALPLIQLPEVFIELNIAQLIKHLHKPVQPLPLRTGFWLGTPAQGTKDLRNLHKQWFAGLPRLQRPDSSVGMHYLWSSKKLSRTAKKSFQTETLKLLLDLNQLRVGSGQNGNRLKRFGF